VSTWIAELRARTGVKAPAHAPAAESPDNSATPSAPSTAVTTNGGPT